MDCPATARQWFILSAAAGGVEGLAMTKDQRRRTFCTAAMNGATDTGFDT